MVDGLQDARLTELLRPTVHPHMLTATTLLVRLLCAVAPALLRGVYAQVELGAGADAFPNSALAAVAQASRLAFWK